MAKKGFVFTIIAVMLLSLLFAIALVKIIPSFGVNVAKKVVYTWDDVHEDLMSLTGLTVTQNGDNLTMNDQIPPSFPVVQSLQAYDNFIQNYYRESAYDIHILDPQQNVITDFNCFGKTDCSQQKVVFTIQPFNISYEYPDWSKNQLTLDCETSSSPPCYFGNVQAINLTFNITSINFSCTPSVWNNCTSNDIVWNQYSKVFGANSCSGNQPCLQLPYNLTLIDSQNKVYACPGQYGDDSGNTKDVNCEGLVWNWLDTSTATLTIKSSPCWLKLNFGQGQFNIQGTQPNSNGACNFTTITSLNLQFNTSDFYVNIPSLLRVRDLTWNSSKIAKI